ncbi:MAG TPA: hypothetical protein VK430_00245 [Xanthobacteraceae bacterium]|nr:hypothetical protein [Xanthobacteraceae bacterium]
MNTTSTQNHTTNQCRRRAAGYGLAAALGMTAFIIVFHIAANGSL